MAEGHPKVLADRFELVDEIGRGGAGRVYRAHDRRLDRAVAVKLLTHHDETSIERFRREAASAARIQHPNVVTLHDVGVHDQVPFLVMRLIEGPSLADRVSEDGPLGPDEARRLGIDLFTGLEATHAAGVLHRDLTPRNVLFDRDGTALLADFGIARGSEDATLTAAHTVVGTRPFLAPERLRGQEATPSTDLFAVGVTLRYAITGHHDAPVPRDHPLAPLVAACTALDPAARPATARAAADRLVALGSDDSQLARTEAMALEDDGASEGEGADEATTDVAGATGGPAATRAASGTIPRARGDGPATDAGRWSNLRRPPVVLGALVALALLVLLAAQLGGSETPEPGATDPAVEPTDEDVAPNFDPDDPAGSARELAEWLREHG